MQLLMKRAFAVGARHRRWYLIALAGAAATAAAIAGLQPLVGVSMGLVLAGAITIGWTDDERRRVLDERLEAMIEHIREAEAGEPGKLVVRADDLVGNLEAVLQHYCAVVHRRAVASDRESAVSRFETQLQRALDMAHDEEGALEVTSRALESVVSGAATEMLLCDDSGVTLRVAATNRLREAPGCPVVSAKNCAAIRHGRPLRFRSSDALDACPHLREHRKAPCSAVCVPVNVMGRTLGVVHTTTPKHGLLPRDQVRLLEAIASHSGARVGMLRTLATTTAAARTDALTRLPNRRHFIETANTLFASRDKHQHTVVMCDLDHFKALNDTHGHAAGDRALRLFADALRTSLRPDDLAGRLGGEEFAIVLPGCSLEAAQAVVERIRDQLASMIKSARGPAFTASFGVASFPADGADFDSVCAAADGALYEAKRLGRNRAVTAGRRSERTRVVLAPVG